MLANPWDVRSVTWELPIAPVIVEVGGFEGRWIAEMAARYVGTYHAFEPQPWAHERIVRAFREAALPGSTLIIHPFGLGAADATLPMRGWGTDACSFLKDDAFFEAWPSEGRNERGEGQIRPVAAVFTEIGIDRVDVMMINIEGYEYVLLPEMVRAAMMPSIRNLAVQFHRDYPASAVEPALREDIGRTHRLIWEWPALTAWTLREDEHHG